MDRRSNQIEVVRAHFLTKVYAGSILRSEIESLNRTVLIQNTESPQEVGDLGRLPPYHRDLAARESRAGGIGAGADAPV